MFKLISEFFSLIEAIIIALVLAVLISIFVIQPYKVDGRSMEPTLEGYNQETEQGGDHVLVFKTPFLLGGTPEFGDIVVVDSRVRNGRGWMDIILESPIVQFLDLAGNNEATHNWIKRVIGEPGDVLEVKNGVLHRNGTALEEEYIKEQIKEDFPPFTVPEDAVFVMGDNRNGSTDSRDVGPIPIDNVIGKVILRYYPFDRIENFLF
ncbi:signal peptidase I [Evansella vedderi]|uniref:Signal peptidase I n=1 Tax=Evansella vedderi TaxID=38282 RepID=A0ABT9ZPK4_9BACI|nr:signal peptidase I [Evansella vedderi]MDQ0252642.1 signal peptidase I [Evansella vedderi]